MAKRIFGIYIVIVIAEIIVSGIVRGIDIDYVDFSGVSVSERCQGFEIVALDDDVIR